RYFLTDALDDFIGTESLTVELLLGGKLVAGAANLILAHARQWQGKGKWIERALWVFDPGAADRMAAVLEGFFRGGDKASLVAFVEDALNLVGGRLVEGFSMGKAP